MSGWRAWLGIVVAASALAFGLPLVAPSVSSAGLIRIDAADFLKGEAAEAGDPADLPWEARALPDLWRTHRPHDSGFGWYRAGFDLEALPESPWAVHIAYANSAVALRVNGIEIGREAIFDALHLTSRASPPHFFTLPPTLLVSGPNTLDVRLRVERDINAGLSAIELGPQEIVLPRYQVERFWRLDLPRALNMASLVAAIFMALLWLRRREEAVYPWFCALALTWALRGMYFTADDHWLLPLRQALGLGRSELFLAASLSLGFALLAIVVNRFARRPMPGPERLALGLCLVLPLSIAPFGNQVLAPLLPAWYALAVLFAGFAAFAAARLARRERHWSYGLILAGIVAMLATGVHDGLVVAGVFDFTPVAWLGYGPAVMLAAMVAALGGRYFHAFDEAARLNRELEQRVRDKTQEIERHYERIAQLEREKAVAGERDRLMRDMHDGVGSQLISMLHALEKGKIDTSRAAALLRESIDDLRLVIDSLDDGTRSMADALADLRFRLEPRLRAAGIASDWEIDDTPVVLSPGVVLQLLRILQEALTNALKHSQAKAVRVSWRTGDRALLTIVDDGIGLPPQAASSGRGLGNMRLRAQRVGAVLEVRSGAASGLRGTVVTLSLGVAPQYVLREPACRQDIRVGTDDRLPPEGG